MWLEQRWKELGALVLRLHHPPSATRFWHHLRLTRDDPAPLEHHLGDKAARVATIARTALSDATASLVQEHGPERAHLRLRLMVGIWGAVSRQAMRTE